MAGKIDRQFPYIIGMFSESHVLKKQVKVTVMAAKAGACYYKYLKIEAGNIVVPSSRNLWHF